MPFATARRTVSPAALGLGAPEAPLDAAVAAESRALLGRPTLPKRGSTTARRRRSSTSAGAARTETLCDLLAAEGRAPLACYLFGAKAKASAWSGLRRGFYFDEGRSGGPGHALPPRDLYALMETFCASADGTLTGFAPGPAAARAGLRAGPRRRARRLGPAGAARDTWPLRRRPSRPRGSRPRDLTALRPTIGGLLEAFWRRPSPAEATAWGGFPGTPVRATSSRSSRSPTATRSPTCGPPGRRSGSASAESSGSRAPSP